jgi:hypothetical protein
MFRHKLKYFCLHYKTRGINDDLFCFYDRKIFSTIMFAHVVDAWLINFDCKSKHLFLNLNGVAVKFSGFNYKFYTIKMGGASKTRAIFAYVCT